MASRAGALAGAGLQAEAARPLLEARDVTVVYGRGPAQITALRRLVLHVRPGELVGLVGPNGSGKTTLVRPATGAVVPQSGAVLLEGEEAAALSQRERARRVAVVPQNPLLPEAFTAFEAVMMGRTPHLRLLQNEGAGDAAIVAEAMRATDTAGLAGRRVICVAGVPLGTPGATNMLRIAFVGPENAREV